MTSVERTFAAAPLAIDVSTTENRSRISTAVFDLICFAVPASIFLKIQVGGELYLPEVLLLALLPFLLLDKERAVEKLPGWIVALAGIWLVGQILTDIYRSTSFEDLARGWSRIIFMVTNLMSLFILVSARKVRIYLFTAGYATGLLLGFVLSPDALAQTYPWKFGLAQPLTLLVVVLACTPAFSHKPIPTLLIASIGVVNLIEGSRGLAGLCFITALYLLMQSALSGGNTPRVSFSLSRLLVTAIILAIGAFAALQTYEYGATRGLLGVKAQRQYQEQAGGAYGVLIGGRSEILVSIDAVRDAPILGHGSWARDHKYVALLDYKLRQLGYQPRNSSSDLIPSHSYLLGAWVESGIAGAIFWLGISALVALVLSLWYRFQDLLAPLIVFTAVGLLWDILFSPFGGDRRLLAPFYVVILLYALSIMGRSASGETHVTGDSRPEAGVSREPVRSLP